jgi:protein involved in polysaccharide export with SLBB domain
MTKSASLILVALLASCGVGTHKRLLTTPADYNERFGFPSTGDPVDVNALVREYPELKGRVLTAPEYMEEYEKWLKERKLQGKPVYEFRFKSGLTFDIEVVGEADISKSVTVNPDGFIYWWRLGKIEVAGKTIEELKSELEGKLGVYFKKPEVLLHVKAGEAQVITPFGPITSSGIIQKGDIVVLGAIRGFAGANIQYTGSETLVRVIGLSGLPSNAEWRNIVVLRRDANDPLRKARIIICDMWAFLRLGDMRQDIPLFPGDVVYAPFRLSVGEQFQKDWALMLSYMGGIFTLDSFKDALKKSGSLRD